VLPYYKTSKSPYFILFFSFLPFHRATFLIQSSVPRFQFLISYHRSTPFPCANMNFTDVLSPLLSLSPARDWLKWIFPFLWPAEAKAHSQPGTDHPDVLLEQQGPSLADRIERAERQLNDHVVMVASQRALIENLSNDVRRLAATIQEQQNQLAALRATIQTVGTTLAAVPGGGGQC
jgi:uncharacterized coiled-coil protein SlyX